ncbi:hypothetical protein [Pseudomonas tolaasii]|nr:hypothetical protein [Pseudomonas tolaasii]PKA77086.1 hypothetical protein ATI14_4111 [Pseudomonas tolaasii NCPPB 2192]
MASEKLFHDWHLPEGMTLVPNAKDEFDSLAKLAEEILRRDLKSYEVPEDLDYLDVPKFLRRQQESAGDKPKKAVHTEPMNDITREEFNAKLETIEVKMDARVESVSAKIESFLASQAERDKAQLERDKRFELLAERVTKAAEGAEDAAKQAATVKSNYWAAVIVQLLAVVAILVGAYYANQANVLGAMQTTMSAFQAGKSESTDAQPPTAPSK